MVKLKDARQVEGLQAPSQGPASCWRSEAPPLAAKPPPLHQWPLGEGQKEPAQGRLQEDTSSKDKEGPGLTWPDRAPGKFEGRHGRQQGPGLFFQAARRSRGLRPAPRFCCVVVSMVEIA